MRVTSPLRVRQNRQVTLNPRKVTKKHSRKRWRRKRQKPSNRQKLSNAVLQCPVVRRHQRSPSSSSAQNQVSLRTQKMTTNSLTEKPRKVQNLCSTSLLVINRNENNFGYLLPIMASGNSKVRVCITMRAHRSVNCFGSMFVIYLKTAIFANSARY